MTAPNGTMSIKISLHPIILAILAAELIRQTTGWPAIDWLPTASRWAVYIMAGTLIIGCALFARAYPRVRRLALSGDARARHSGGRTPINWAGIATIIAIAGLSAALGYTWQAGVIASAVAFTTGARLSLPRGSGAVIGAEGMGQ